MVESLHSLRKITELTTQLFSYAVCSGSRDCVPTGGDKPFFQYLQAASQAFDDINFFIAVGCNIRRSSYGTGLAAHSPMPPQEGSLFGENRYCVAQAIHDDDTTIAVDCQPRRQ